MEQKLEYMHLNLEMNTLHYWVAARFGIKTIPNHADFRLMSHKAIAMLGKYGVSPEAAIAFSYLCLLVNIVFGNFLGVFYWLKLNNRVPRNISEEAAKISTDQATEA